MKILLSFSEILFYYLGCMIIRASIVQATACTMRCGLFRRSMYTGVDRTSSCQNQCVFTLFGHTRLSFKCGTCNPNPITLSPVTSSPVTSTPVTSSPVTSSPVTRSPITRAPVTRSPVTPAPVTRSPVTPAPVSRSIITDNCDNTSSTEFDICLKLRVDPRDIELFRSARTRWSEVIKGDKANIQLITGLQRLPCGAYPSQIDDLYICGVALYIDGPGKILGSAGPLYSRISDSIPVVGSMRFDEVDLARLRQQGRLKNVILHEMGHIIGLGTIWDDKNVANISSSNQCVYTGVNANNEYKKITGCPIVPMELDGGSGTACGHWDEECLQDELMTGFSSNAIEPLSAITIGSLQDIGYDVDYSQADTYTSLNIKNITNCTCNRRRLNEYPGLNDNNDDPKIDNNDRHRAKHHKLSEEGFTIATNYGQKILQDNRKFSNARSIEVNNPDLMYVGHRGILVYYFENDVIHDVWVTPALNKI